MSIANATWFGNAHICREVVARVILSVLAAATSILSLVAPTTFTYKMLLSGGIGARVGVVAVGVLGVLLFTDAIVNDVLPNRFHFRWGKLRRQDMWMALGLAFIVFAFLVFTTNLSVSLGTYLVVYGLGSIALAFVDAAAEKVSGQRCGAT